MAQMTEEQARKRAKDYTDLIWHVGAFVIINAMLWLIDIAGGLGVNWAYWVTIFWGVGLAFHGLAYYVDGRQLEDRMTEEILERDRETDSSPT